MKHFIIIKTYAPEDKNFSSDEWNVELYDLDIGRTIMEGDSYHNKIHDKIQGFFKALDYLSIKYEYEIECKNDDSYTDD